MTDADTDGLYSSVIINIFLQIYETSCSSRSCFIALPPLYKLEKGKGKSKK